MTNARLAPAMPREMRPLDAVITAALGAVAGTDRPNVFTTLARHRRMFRPWLRFAATLMPAGSLPARDTELVILRVAHLCGCHYEWQHHERLSREAGLSQRQIDAVRDDSGAGAWEPRQHLILAATDELHSARVISDQTWQRIAAELDERQLIELPMLVGHYEMLAITINSLGIQPDCPRPDSRLARGVRALRARTRRGSA